MKTMGPAAWLTFAIEAVLAAAFLFLAIRKPRAQTSSPTPTGNVLVSPTRAAGCSRTLIDVAEARNLLARLHVMAEGRYVPGSCFAWIHLGLGELDEAFSWLNRAIDERDPNMTPIKSYDFFDPIRSDPRFAALLRKMNLDTAHANW